MRAGPLFQLSVPGYANGTDESRIRGALEDYTLAATGHREVPSWDERVGGGAQSVQTGSKK
jgi:hypothetical protein